MASRRVRTKSAGRSAGKCHTAAGAQLNVLGQYIKDLSFESPGAPEVLQSPPPNPQLQVTVNVTALGRSPKIFEVILSLEVHAKSDTGVIYNVELLYGGLFRLRNIPQNLLAAGAVRRLPDASVPLHARACCPT